MIRANSNTLLATEKPRRPAPAARPRGISRSTWFFLAALLAVGAAAASWFLWGSDGGWNRAETAVSKFELKDIPFNGTRAYEYLKRICAIGPRPSGSPGMLAQRKLLEEHFKKLGAPVELQRFQARDPRDGKPVEMANLLVHFFPEKKQRILLAAHYDTLPFPMLDPENPRGVFVGAHDNASGVALLMELGKEISQSKEKYRYGIDLLFLDGEEYIFSEGEPMFLGAWYFSRQYVDRPPPYRYRWGVLLDMIGDRDLQIYQDRSTLVWRDSRPLVAQIWNTAARLGVKEFIARPKHEVQDDHVVLHNIGRIPFVDVIDFDYPVSPENRYWHTTADTPDKCSPLSLAKVGWVIAEWLKTTK
ncbi:MAG: M28 family peptidase [Pirellulales bacterium]|nr:M28 family peptidase [Pirellulales bacterium]